MVTVASRGTDLGIAKAAARIDSTQSIHNIDGLFKFVFSSVWRFYILLLPFLLAYLIYEKHSLRDTLILFFALAILGFCFLFMNILSYLYQGIGNIFMMILSQRTIFNLFAFLLLGGGSGYFYLQREVIPEISVSYQALLIMLASVVAASLFFIYYNSTIIHSKSEYIPDGFYGSCKELFRIQIMQLATMYGSQIVINFFATKSDIAGFIISQRISTLLGFLVLAVSSVISSQVSKAYVSNDIKTVQKHAFQSFMFASTLGLPVAFFLIFFSKECLGLFGKDFIQYSIVLTVLVFSQIINCLTGACDIVLMFIDGEKEHKKNVIVGTVFALVLSITLIPFYAAMGAALAAAVSATLVNLLDVISIKRKAGFWIFKSN